MHDNVIAREGGRSSNHRPMQRFPRDDTAYWMPAFAGMTPDIEEPQ